MSYWLGFTRICAGVMGRDEPRGALRRSSLPHGAVRVDGDGREQELGTVPTRGPTEVPPAPGRPTFRGGVAR